MQSDPAPNSLDHTFPRPPVKHFASISDPKLVGEMLRSFDAHQGSVTVFNALRLSPLIFVRPGELRRAEWSQFDLAGRVWDIPEGYTKTGLAFLVPLSDQAMMVLLAQRQISYKNGNGKYVFPSERGDGRCMSSMTINAAMQRLGWNTKTQITNHGFRSMARTMLVERNSTRKDAIEVQLGHTSAKSHNGAYDRAKFLDERVVMMQVWADYLDELKAGVPQPSLTRQSFDMSAYQ